MNTKQKENIFERSQKLELVDPRGSLSAVVEIQTTCPVCSSNKNHPIRSERNLFPDGMDKSVLCFNGTWIQLLMCEDCSFGFTKEKPTDPDYFDSRYDLKFDVTKQESSDQKDEINEALFDWVKSYGVKTGKHLDIGAFAGKFVRCGLRNGFSSEGIEVNPTMAKFSSEKLNLKVSCGSFKDTQFDPESYELLSFIDVLEHLWGPMAILEKSNKILKPGGAILVKVPNLIPQLYKQRFVNLFGINNLGVMENFGHINHFSPRSLEKALTLSGFKDVKVIVAKSEYYPNPNTRQRFSNHARKWAPRVMELFRASTGINLGFNIVAIARK